MRLLIALIIVLIGFKTFYLTPLGVYAKFLIFGIATLAFIFNFRAIIKIFWFKLIGIMVLISILNSYLIFHQSFIASIIANSSLIEVFALSFIFTWLNKDAINFGSLLKWLIISAWIYSVIVFLISALHLNFAVSTSEGMVCREAGKLSKHLIFFGFFFYFFLFRRTKKFRHLLYCFWFIFVTQIYDIQRGDIIFIVVAITLFSFIQSRYKGITVIGMSLSGYFTLATLNYIFANSLIKDKFVQMSYFIQPEKWDLINDASIAVRLREIEFVMSYIVESPFFGAGLVKPGNYTDYFGDQHFYIQDIGLIGIFFSFGLFGLIYYFFTVYKTIGLQKIVINKKLNVYGLNLYLLFFVLYGLKSGISVYVPFIMLFCIFSIDFVKHQHLTSENSSKQDEPTQQDKLMGTIAKRNR
jgi:hypothetical protein